MLNTLYTPPDVDAVFQEWGANCGPTALAAVLGCPVSEVRHLFPDFAKRKYANPSQIRQAVESAGRSCQVTPQHRNGRDRLVPRNGLMFLQWSSDDIDRKPIIVQYRSTHWVGVRDQLLYDCNAADGQGAWLDKQDWKLELWPLFQEATGATRFWIRTAYEVR